MTVISIVLTLLISIILFYILFQLLQGKRLEALIIEKQKEQSIELRKSSYKVHYSYISILVLTLFVVITTGIKPPLVKEDSRILSVLQEELPDKINLQNNGIFIITVDYDIEILEYVETTQGELFIDPDNTTVIDGVIVEDAQLQVETNVLQIQTDEYVNYTVYGDLQVHEDEGVYLIIGGVVSEDDQVLFQNEFITYNNQLYPWNVYLIEDYDVYKSYEDQSEEIKNMILEIIQRYYD